MIRTTPELEAPNAGELDALAVLWEEEKGANESLQLSEIHYRVSLRREAFMEPRPALTTVSTHLRNLARKGLVEEVMASRKDGNAATDARAGDPTRVRRAIRTRGGYTPPTRSPLTSYRARYSPGDVLLSTFRGLASAYAAGEELTALRDFAKALNLPTGTRRRLEQFLRDESARAP